MDAPRAIVLVKLSAIGDVLHGVPTAVALKRAFPRTPIGWVVEGRAADVLAGHSAVDHLFRLPRGWLRSWAVVRSLRRQLVDYGTDVTVDMQGLLKSAVATRLSGAAIRIGHARPESREGSWLAYTHALPTLATHVVERNLGLLSPLGVRVERPSFDMPEWPASRHRVREWFAHLRLSSAPVIMNPGAGWTSKLWPEDRFAAIARAIRERHGISSLVVWGGDHEHAAANRIAAAAGGAALVAPPTTLQDLATACRLARLFVSSDTGPLHLAAAVGTPCVGLFGPVPAARNGPYGDGHATVEPPVTARPDWAQRKTDTASMAAIPVETVLAACSRLLARSVAA